MEATQKKVSVAYFNSTIPAVAWRYWEKPWQTARQLVSGPRITKPSKNEAEVLNTWQGENVQYEHLKTLKILMFYYDIGNDLQLLTVYKYSVM
jgi:hypothetical protein